MIVKLNIQDLDELRAYQKGLLNILSKVDTDDLDPTSIEDIKSVYKLLDRLRIIDKQNQIIKSKQLSV